ncbi:MAG: 4-phosphopantoate--beta-alanine ligase [Candidatus Lokiarchaeota archaeon]|jgi:4-phosphopantoate--beta-alanine ligase
MNSNQKHIGEVPTDHPRYLSLKYRHKITEGMHNLVVAEAGLIAHGRGECFDYILGEKTNKFARKAIKAAVALLILAEHPIISVNGNTAALCPKELVSLSKIINTPLEINLFYRKEGRVKAISKLLEKQGALNVLGTDNNRMIEIDELSSNRRRVDPDGIYSADVVFVPLEDGDRTEALKKIGKKVIAVDLNPLSRTALWADITIIDNIVRTLPLMIEISKDLKYKETTFLNKIVINYNNQKNIKEALNYIIRYLKSQKRKAFDILKI